MSTISPDSSREMHRLGASNGIEVLDVAISGSTPAAEEGVLTLLVGGNQDLFHAAEPIFQAIARQYFLLGGPGSGTTMKLVVNTAAGCWHAGDRGSSRPGGERGPGSGAGCSKSWRRLP